MSLHRIVAALACLLLITPSASAQRSWRSPGLPRERTRSGELTLEAFAAVSRSARDSVVSFQVDGKKAALGAIIEPNGLIVTKASEIDRGKLTCTLADGKTLDASVLAVDEDNDLALVQIEAEDLKPIEWASEESNIGRWAVTPGVGPLPEAVGIVSSLERRILPEKAVIGVLPDFSAPAAQVRRVMPGLGAEKAGMKPGDIIIAVNDTLVGDGEALVATLREFREGQTVTLRIRRDGDELELAVPMAVPQEERSGGFDRQERMNRMGGELSRRSEGFQLAMQHDTALQPWQCGGPLVNLDGKAIGLNIARAGRIASYALPAELVEKRIARLKRQTKI